MPTDTISSASFLISSLAFLLLGLFFADTLLLRFDLKTLLKSLGFILLSASSLLNLFGQSYSTSFWMALIALYLIYSGFIIDPLSKFKFLLPLPLVFLPFLTGHLLLFALGSLTTVTIFYLAYITKHWDLVPLGVGFTLLSVGEYLYYLQTMENLRSLSAAGSFLYLFCSLVLIVWVWSYLAIRVMNLLKS